MESKVWLVLFCTMFILFMRESTEEIPSTMWLQMKNISSTADFIKLFLRKKQQLFDYMDIISGTELPGKGRIPGESIMYTQEGSLIPGGSEEVARLLSIQQDKCEIKLVSVPVPRHIDPNVIYWPSCVKLDQCSGCCNNEILECVPILVQGVEMQVLRARYPFVGADYFEFEGIHPMVFNRHVGCECRCRIQADDCNMTVHTYDRNSCTCRCFNELDAQRCAHPKTWNHAQCRCACPARRRDCYVGETYDERTCSCVRNGGSSQPAQAMLTSCDESRLHCRHGFIKQRINGICQCTLAPRGVRSHRRSRPSVRR